MHSVPIRRAAAKRDALAPDGSEIRLLAGSEELATRASLCLVTLPAGHVSHPVWHQHVEEIWYVMEGKGEVWRSPRGSEPSATAPQAVQPGDTLVIPCGWRFQFRAGEGLPLSFLCFTSPPWPGPGEAQPAGAGGLGEPTVSG